MAWLVPAVYVSVVVGAFTNRRAGLRVIRELEDELGDMWPIADPDKSVSISTIRVPGTTTTSHSHYLLSSHDPLGEALPWEGGNYCWRPSKRLAPSSYSRARSGSAPRDQSLALLYTYAMVPVVLAASCAMALSCLTPTFGPGCRFATLPFSLSLPPRRLTRGLGTGR